MSRAVLKASAAFLVLALILVAGSLYASVYQLGEQQRLAAAGDLEGSMDSAQLAARLDPFNPEPLQAQSVLLQRQGRTQDAVEALRTAAERDPHNYVPRMLLGNLQSVRLNDYAAAAESYRQALELNPNSSTLKASLAQSLMRTGDVEGNLEEARRLYEELRRDGRISNQDLYNLGRLYLITGDPEQGLEVLRDARERATAGLERLSPAQRAQREGFVRSVDLAIADALVVQRRYDEARQVVQDSGARQAAAILSLLDSDPEAYRQSVLEGELY